MQQRHPRFRRLLVTSFSRLHRTHKAPLLNCAFDSHYSHILKPRMFKHLFVNLLHRKERTVEGRVSDDIVRFGFVNEHFTNIAKVLPHILEVFGHVVGEQVAILVIGTGYVGQRFFSVGLEHMHQKRASNPTTGLLRCPKSSHRLPIKFTGVAPICEIFQPVHIGPQFADVGNRFRIGGM